MNLKPLYLLLGMIALLLAANLIAMLAERSGAAPATAAASLVLPAAQAQSFSNSPSTGFFLDRDSFFITADTSGQNVYLWWFEREPRKEQSTVVYLGKGQAR